MASDKNPSNYANTAKQRLSPANRKVFENLSQEQQQAVLGGYGGAKGIITGLQVERNENTSYIFGNQKENNLVAIGVDEELSRKGYEATAVKLVAGFSKHKRLASEFKEEDTKSAIRPLDLSIDCATLEVVELTNPDDRLGLASGGVGSSSKVSAIIGKADAIRLVAENGIKLVTAVSSVNSKDDPHIRIKGIDLIAGNTESGLQPIAKGQNTADCINALADIVNDLINYTMQIILYQGKANIQTAGHVHQDSTGEFTFTGLTSHVSANMAAANQYSFVIQGQLDSLKKRIDGMKDLFINNPTSQTSIMSPYNKTN